MRYTQLTRDERYQIHELQWEGLSGAEIARRLHRDRSTISRELLRNRGVHQWRPGQAHAKALARRQQNRNARRTEELVWQDVVTYLRLDLSPEQAIHRLALERGGAIGISHQTVYQRIYADRRAGGELITYLRGQKPRRQRSGSHYQRRGGIPGRIGIEHRPAIVEQRARIGDWEGDTIIGKDQQGVLVTLVERVSRFTLAHQLDSKHARGVSAAILHLLGEHRQKCHTITFDNGLEFADHAILTGVLHADIYFARPYHSWERGLNENTNGLIRHYFPKKTNLKRVSQETLQVAIDQLNHRPRKCLGYRTPYEVFYNLDTLPLNLPRVALRV